MSLGEVAQLREKIEREIEAVERGISGYAVTSRHDLINHRYEQIVGYQKQLEQHIGIDAAKAIVIQAFKAVEQENT